MKSVVFVESRAIKSNVRQAVEAATPENVPVKPDADEDDDG